MVALRRRVSLSTPLRLRLSTSKTAAASGPKSADAVMQNVLNRSGDSGVDVNVLHRSSDSGVDVDGDNLYSPRYRDEPFPGPSPDVLDVRGELLSEDDSDSAEIHAGTFGLRRCVAVDDLSLVPGDVELEIDVHLDFVPYSVAVSYNAESPVKLSSSSVRVTIQSLAPLISIKRMLTGLIQVPRVLDASSDMGLAANVTLFRNGRILDDDLAEIYSYDIRSGDIIHCVI